MESYSRKFDWSLRQKRPSIGESRPRRTSPCQLDPVLRIGREVASRDPLLELYKSLCPGAPVRLRHRRGEGRTPAAEAPPGRAPREALPEVFNVHVTLLVPVGSVVSLLLIARPPGDFVPAAGLAASLSIPHCLRRTGPLVLRTRSAVPPSHPSLPTGRVVLPLRRRRSSFASGGLRPGGLALPSSCLALRPSGGRLARTSGSLRWSTSRSSLLTVSGGPGPGGPVPSSLRGTAPRRAGYDRVRHGLRPRYPTRTTFITPRRRGGSSSSSRQGGFRSRLNVLSSRARQRELQTSASLNTSIGSHL